ncbi:MAG: hypothetical protein AB7F40_01555 [Victivallaceae bacterium]|nr:hypothetical protein [Victivallaceae bacterium]
MNTAFEIGLIVAAVAFMLSALGIARLRPEKTAAAERFCRAPLLGAVLAAVALSLCVPQTEPIAWDWLRGILWPLVVVFTVLGYLYLDFLTSRAIAGLMILGAYYFVNQAFALRLPTAAIGSVAALALGAAGIWISARPYLLRDFLRRCAAGIRLRAVAALACVAFGWYCAAVAVIMAVRR